MSSLSITTINAKLLNLKDIVLRQCANELPAQDIRYLKIYRELALEMFEIMYANYGAALAAPQVGISLRLVVMDPARVPFGPHVMINPTVLYKSASEESGVESCLSLPNYAGKVFRSTSLCVSAYNLNGEREEYNAEGLLARIFQHELDHLDGVLYPDHLRPGDILERADRGTRRKAIEAINSLQGVLL